MLRKDEIIGFFDIETTTGAEVTREFLGKASKKKRVVSLTDELPASFIITCGKNTVTQTVYITELSTTTLRRERKTK